MSVLEAHGITHRFNRGRLVAVNDLSLNVEPGTIFGLLGPNGAGKTTFIKLVLGILRIQQGDASLFGIPVADPQSRQRIGYLPENHRFPAFLNGGALLDFAGRLSGMRDASARRERAEALLKQVRMWEWRNTRIRKYSKGMVQRLGLAQALLHDPDLIFLDEPTDGVDPLGRREIRDLLLALRAEGKSIFLNSHLLSEVELICDEVAILDKGRLLRQGSVQELTTSERRYELHVDADDDLLLEKVKQQCVSAARENGYIDVVVKDLTQLNALIDDLRSRKVLIRAVTPHKQTLEDSFLQTIAGATLKSVLPETNSPAEKQLEDSANE